MIDFMRMHEFSEEQRLMWQTAKDVVDDVIIPFNRANREREWLMSPEERLLPTEIVNALDQSGIRTIMIPEEYGGTELEPGTIATTCCLVATELARGDAGIANALTPIWKSAILYRKYMPKEFQDEWFPKIMEDPHFLSCQAVSEPQGASDRWLPYEVPSTKLKSTAVLDGDEWVINGGKQFITNGYDANLIQLYVTTDKEANMWQGTSCIIVPKDTPGVSVTRCNETMGLRYMNNGELVFQDVRVPKENMMIENTALGTADIVFYRLVKVIQSSYGLGLCLAAFNDTATFAQDNVQGGREIIKHQAIAVRMSDMAIKIAALRAYIFSAAKALDENPESEDAGLQCEMLKVYAADTAIDVCHQAVEIHGGYGTMIEFGVEKYLRDALMFSHMDGTKDICAFRLMQKFFPDTAGAYAGPVTKPS